MRLTPRNKNGDIIPISSEENDLSSHHPEIGIMSPFLLERETGIEPATSNFGRRNFENDYILHLNDLQDVSDSPKYDKNMRFRGVFYAKSATYLQQKTPQNIRTLNAFSRITDGLGSGDTELTICICNLGSVRYGVIFSPFIAKKSTPI